MFTQTPLRRYTLFQPVFCICPFVSFHPPQLIDLGACADLRTGTNYVPDESILDPNYCPPEQYILPTDSPHLAKSMLKLAISPMLWAQVSLRMCVYMCD